MKFNRLKYKNWTNKSNYNLFIIFVLLFITSEAILRMVWGFCDSPLCLSNAKYEYIYAPNQHRCRFRKLVNYNKYSQRSEEVNAKKEHILGLGDSVINGGTLTDQAELATSIFSKETGTQMLNISAGSWGPDNCAAYLKENGLFNSTAIFLVVSSHDAHDNMNFMKVVDIHPSYPSKQYKLATWELLDRFLFPRILRKFQYTTPDPDAAVSQGIRKKGVPFNPGFDQLKSIAAKAGIPLFVYLHPELVEVKAGEYNDQGDEIINWAIQNKIILFKGLELEEEDCFRDEIHMNAIGQRRLADSMEKMVGFKKQKGH